MIRNLLYIFIVFSILVKADFAFTQELDENSLLATEDVLIDDVLEEDLIEEEKPIEKQKPIEKSEIDEDNLDIEEAGEDIIEEPVEASEEEIVAEEDDQETVEELAEDALGEDIIDENEEPTLEEKMIAEAGEEKGIPAIDEGEQELLNEDISAESPVEEDLSEDIVNEPVEEVAEEDFLVEDQPSKIEALAESPAEEDLSEDIVNEPVEEDSVKINEEVEEDTVREAIEDAVADAVADGVSDEPELTTEAKVSEDIFTEAIAEGVQEAPILDKEQEEEEPVVALDKHDVEKGIKHTDKRSVAISLIDDEEILKRRAYEKHAFDLLRRADKSFKSHKYKDAVKLYEESLSVFNMVGKRSVNIVAIHKVKDGLATCYYKLALSYRKYGDSDKAEQFAENAANYGHTGAKRLADLLREEKKHPRKPKPEPVKKYWQEKEFKKVEMDIKNRLRVGKELFLSGAYNEAEKVYESILSEYPQNTEAIRLLKEVAGKKYDIASMELETTRLAMMADLRKTWNPRNYTIIKNIKKPGGGKIKPPDRGETSKRLQIIKKMESLKIPEIDFRQANIHDVIDFLQEASVEFDSEVPSDDPNFRKGVNIILNLGISGGTRSGSNIDKEVDPFAEDTVDEEVSGGGGGGGDVPLITFSARNISLLEALKIVTDVANLKYRVEGSVVMIVPFDAPIGTIIVRTYNVLPSVEEKIPTVSSDLSSNNGGDEDFTAIEGGGPGLEGSDWKNFFAEMGVKWPIGSSIKYVRSIGKIVVANTENNLTIFEKILSELNVVPNQIEIEARFVEVRQTDLSSLGFEWLLTDDWEIAQKKGGLGVPISSRPHIKVNANSASGGFTGGNRFVRNLNALSSGSSVSDNILSIGGVLTNPELTFILHMLQQKGNTDLLSSPKVTTQAGQEATIKVVTEYIYPTEFTVTPITGTDATGNSTIVGGVVEPGGFETREVGVILQVSPDVSSEGQMITLNMAPEVVSDPTWRNYGSTYTAPDGSVMQLTMEQPFFHTRSIQTSISIYNGATVVMGGMINELRNDVEDKIPILGDIPIIGRFFRSKYEQSEKRNLLIFVTARLVDPAGHPIEQSGEDFTSRMANRILLDAEEQSE